MDLLTEATLPVFLLQAAIVVLYIPATYLGYLWMQAPMKQEQVAQSMSELGLAGLKNWQQTTLEEHSPRYYLGPVLAAMLLTFLTFSLTHPYIIGTGLKVGLLEEVIDVFGPQNPFPRALAFGRFLFWGWLGAYLYSFQLILRRFMEYDLTPKVYLYTCTRFLLAFVVGSIVGVGLGSFSTAAGVSFDVNLATVSVVAFFIGFFPEQGINWIAATAKKALGQQGGIVKESRLAEIEGLSIWQQGRLKQEDIENVQNLATADIPTLVMKTSFNANQIIDWVDQAILIIYTSPDQLEALARIGLSRASDALANTDNEANLADLVEASGLTSSELKVLSRMLHSAPNIKTVTRFCWQSSLDGNRAAKAAAIQPEPGVRMATAETQAEHP